MQLDKATPERQIYEKRMQSLQEATRISQRIIRFFPNTGLRNGHDGLSRLAMNNDINTSRLNLGEYVIFTNRARTALKMYAPNNIIVHQRMPQGARIDMRVINLIPKYFNGSRINMDQALKEVIQRALT
jgi:hypothetical protein